MTCDTFAATGKTEPFLCCGFDIDGTTAEEFADAVAHGRQIGGKFRSFGNHGGIDIHNGGGTRGDKGGYAAAEVAAVNPPV